MDDNMVKLIVFINDITVQNASYTDRKCLLLKDSLVTILY